MKRSIFILTILSLFFACVKNEKKEINAQGDWLKGTEEEQLKSIEKQFRGFDHVMVEVGYRFQELYWGGQDQNWEYADYQLEKIKLAIENGMIRRPKRAKSAEVFLKGAYPEMKKATEARDLVVFNAGIEKLKIGCNSCHMMEKMSFFVVQTPKERQSPLGK
jgi:hypothetical protein